jgi:hypothetical protein
MLNKIHKYIKLLVFTNFARIIQAMRNSVQRSAVLENSTLCFLAPSKTHIVGGEDGSPMKPVSFAPAYAAMCRATLMVSHWLEKSTLERWWVRLMGDLAPWLAVEVKTMRQVPVTML